MCVKAEGFTGVRMLFIFSIYLVVGGTQIPGVGLNKVNKRFRPGLEKWMTANDEQEFF
jgi:hypothetical protein